MPEPILTQSHLKELLTYDPITGIFIWKVRFSNRNKIGGVAGGSLSPDGYYRVGIYGESYLLHRLAWFYDKGKWPVSQIDHKDHIRHHNWIDNLRCATHRENGMNQGLSKNNTSGVTGIYFHNQTSKWRARISVKGKGIHLGCLDSLFEAVCARRSAEIFYGFHENHGK